MSWIQRLFSNLGLGGSPKQASRPAARSSRPATRAIECGRCGLRIRVRAPRCPRCGARVVRPGDREDAKPRTRTAPARSGPSRVPSGLSPLQERVLAATRDAEDGLIHVIPATGTDQGEIKAGVTRVSGAKALDAVEQLLKVGMLSQVGSTTYSLTVNGHAAARELAERDG